MKIYILKKNDNEALDNLGLDKILYNDNKIWKAAISEESYMLIENHIKILKDKYSNLHKKNRRIINTYKRYELILKNAHSIELNENDLNEFNYVVRKNNEWKDDDLYSDISNTGFKGITLTKTKKEGTVLVTLRSMLSKDTYLGKSLTAGNKYTLKYCIYNLLLLKSNNLNITIPKYEDCDFSKAYRFSDILDYNGDPHGKEVDLPLDMGKINIGNINSKSKKNRTPLKKETSSTGYNNISLSVTSRETIILLLSIRDSESKEIIRESVQMDGEEDYESNLIRLLKIKCEHENRKMPKEVDFETGKRTLLRLFEETNKNFSIFKNDFHMGDTNTGYKNIFLLNKVDSKGNKILSLYLNMSLGEKKISKYFTVYGNTIKKHLKYLIDLRCDFLNIKKPEVIKYETLMVNVKDMLEKLGHSDKINNGEVYDINELKAIDFRHHFLEIKRDGNLKKLFKYANGKVYLFKTKKEKDRYSKIMKYLNSKYKNIFLSREINIDKSISDDWIFCLSESSLNRYINKLLKLKPKRKEDKVSRTKRLNSVKKLKSTLDTYEGSYKYIKLYI